MADELFTEGRLDEVLDEQLKRAESVVDEMPAKSVRRRKSAVKAVLAELAVEPPAIKRDKAKIDVAEGSPMTARLQIPYSGDPAMFALRPTEYSVAPPEATVRDPDDESVVEFVSNFAVDNPPDVITTWATNAAESLEQYLYWQAADIGAHTIRLRERVEELVNDRKSRLDSVSEVQAELDEVDDV
jgi:hypothetical protein